MCANGSTISTGFREIDAVSRSDRQTVDNRGRCDKAILDRHGFPGFAKMRQQFRPFQACVGIPGNAVETAGPCVEPAFQRGPLLSLGKDKNAEAQFPENYRIDCDVRLMRREASRQLADPAMVSSARSKRWRQPDTSQGIGRLRVDGNKKILVRTGE